MSSDVPVDPGSPARSIRKPGPLLGVRVFRVVLWLVLFTGPVLAGLGLVLVSDLAGRVETLSRLTGAQVPADTGPVEGFAELFLATYLTETMGASPSGRPEDDGGRRLVARTVSLGAEQIDVGYYAVTVAAVVRPDDTAPADVAPAEGSLVYRVSVVETDSSFAVVGPPSLIPTPLPVAAPDLLVDRMDGLETAGLEEATVRFLAAYLAGEGELARYTAPGSQLAPVLPPPFATVEILESGSVLIDENGREVVVTVEGIDGSGRSQVLQFGLVMGQRDGRWEVVELLSAPSLSKGKE